jgi:hypothetical protein
MSVTDQTNIRPGTNHIILHKFQKPVPTITILILDESERYGQDLMVAIDTNCGQNLTSIFAS